MGAGATTKVGIIAASGLFCGVLLSWPLWYPDARSGIPLLPAPGFEGFESIPGALQASLFVALLIARILLPGRRWISALLLLVLTILCLLDVNRLQPWVWFYGLVLALLLGGKKGPAPDAVSALRLVLTAVYVWGGFNKLTPYFAEDNFPWFCEAFAPLRLLGQFPLLGYGVALFEMALGIGLLLPKTRLYTRYVAIGFHGFIALALSPLGLHWNTVAIPWNFAMAALLWLLFSEKERVVLPKHPVALLLIALAWLAPALNFFRAWPDALSWKMYSNTQPEATFYTHGGPPCAAVQAVWKASAFDEGRNLLLDDWSQADLHTPLYTSRRTFMQLGRYLCHCADNQDSAGIYILTVNRWNKRQEGIERIPCKQIMMNGE